MPFCRCCCRGPTGREPGPGTAKTRHDGRIAARHGGHGRRNGDQSAAGVTARHGGHSAVDVECEMASDGRASDGPPSMGGWRVMDEPDPCRTEVTLSLHQIDQTEIDK